MKKQITTAEYANLLNEMAKDFPFVAALTALYPALHVEIKEMLSSIADRERKECAKIAKTYESTITDSTDQIRIHREPALLGQYIAKAILARPKIFAEQIDLVP